ncbi:MAG: hypothetical protein QOJ27_2652, partial [Sphingomonadales bacterium]|nr:hypothetical protein [Sphingomonadales bacterium]
MSDFLDRMASRSQGAAPILHPRPLALFEGGPELLEEVHVEREAAPSGRRAAPPPQPAGRAIE